LVVWESHHFHGGEVEVGSEVYFLEMTEKISREYDYEVNPIILREIILKNSLWLCLTGDGRLVGGRGEIDNIHDISNARLVFLLKLGQDDL